MIQVLHIVQAVELGRSPNGMSGIQVSLFGLGAHELLVSFGYRFISGCYFKLATTQLDARLSALIGADDQGITPGIKRAREVYIHLPIESRTFHESAGNHSSVSADHL